MMVSSKNKALVWIVVLVCLLLGGGYSFATSTSEQTSPLIINELLASNEIGLTDEDGDYSDWVEIYNRGNQPANLSGWALTDDPAQPEKWLFPDITLGSDEYLIIFASGKNRQSAEIGSPLHTNFRLSRAGEFLGLYRVLDRRFMDAISPQIPGQLRNISYGRYADGLTYGYLATPSPAGPNDVGLKGEGIVALVEFSVKRGVYDAPFNVELTTSTPGASVHYTTDGSEPTASHGTLYAEPVEVDSTTLLRAAAFKPNSLPSPVETNTYIFLVDVLAQPPNPPGFPDTWGTHAEDFKEYTTGSPVTPDYEMDPDIVNDPRYRSMLKEGLISIPTLSIVTDIKNLDIYSHPRDRGPAWERPVSVELIYPNDARPGFQVNAGIRIQGGVGRKEFMPKHSFRLFFRSEYGPTRLRYPFFPDSPVAEFDTLVLRGGVNRSYVGTFAIEKTTYTRDEWLRASQIAMSGLSSHGTFVHLYLNGLYWGLYNVIERPDAAFTSAYLGGDEAEWVAMNHSGPVSGSDDQLKPLIRQFVEFNRTASFPDRREKYKAIIQSLIDLNQFSDYIILNWYAGNEDWGENNWYIGLRHPDGRINYFVWDAEKILFKGAEIYLGKITSARPNVVKPLFDILMEDPDFRVHFADRMHQHLFNDGVLSDANSQARWMRINGMIEQAIAGESARWGDTRKEIPINPDDWLEARDDVLRQLDGNAARLIRVAREAGYYPDIDPPTFNQHGGLVTTGFELVMSPAEGGRMGRGSAIYYTLDGSDPRMLVTGKVAPEASLYQTPVVITSTTQVKARALADGVWSALNQATFAVTEQDSQLRVTEIMYNPLGGADYEFIELKNTGDTALSLANLAFEGIRFTFPADTPQLAPGEFIVLVHNPLAFAERYPGISITGAYVGQLSNSGEKISLKDPQGNVVVAVRYDDDQDWPISPDGRGDSLVLINPDGDPDDPKNWQASTNLNGSPGADDPAYLTSFYVNLP